MKGIYSIVNIRNGKKYIGSSKNIERRKQEHKAALVAGEHYNYALQRDFTYYGCEVFRFRVLEEVEEVRDLKRREHFYLNRQPLSELYNAVSDPWYTPRGLPCLITESKPAWGFKVD